MSSRWPTFSPDSSVAVHPGLSRDGVVCRRSHSRATRILCAASDHRADSRGDARGRRDQDDGATDKVLVSLPPAETDTQSGRAKITESDFIEQLSRSSSPEVVKFAEWVIEHAPAHGLTLTWGDDGPLLKYEDDETGHFFTFGQLSRSGTLASTHRLFGGFSEARTRQIDLSALLGPSRGSDSGRYRLHGPHPVWHGARGDR